MAEGTCPGDECGMVDMALIAEEDPADGLQCSPWRYCRGALDRDGLKRGLAWWCGRQLEWT